MLSIIRSLSQHEELNFLLTNRIPRRYLTLFMGWFSKKENVLLTRISISIWKIFANDMDLSEAKKQNFKSLHDCFIRELKDGSRIVDKRENIITSPCDAIIGSFGKINGTTVYQAKGFPYDISDLIPDKNIQNKYKNGIYITLRLKSSMYHHFHAPVNCRVDKVTYISGDTWNVNPVALKRIEKLYCKNERAVLELHTDKENSGITLVPVAAILVASMKFNCLGHKLNLKYEGPNNLNCHAHYQKGEEMGYFEHGSTIILFATSDHFLDKSIKSGKRIQMGQPLLLKNNT